MFLHVINSLRINLIKTSINLRMEAHLGITKTCARPTFSMFQTSHLFIYFSRSLLTQTYTFSIKHIHMVRDDNRIRWSDLSTLKKGFLSKLTWWIMKIICVNFTKIIHFLLCTSMSSFLSTASPISIEKSLVF